MHSYRMEWRKMASELMEKIRNYGTQVDDWKVAKETKNVTVWYKTSSEWKGYVYKTVGDIDADPETVFRFVDPSPPDAPRNKWDASIKQRKIIQQIDTNIMIMHTVTHSGLGGLISSRDFVDLLVIDKNEESLATNVQSVTHSDFPVTAEAVRGVNQPSAIICSKIPNEPQRTRLTTLIQTDLGGMLPNSLVVQALPSSQIQFFTSLKQALKDAGHLNDVGSVAHN